MSRHSNCGGTTWSSPWSHRSSRCWCTSSSSAIVSSPRRNCSTTCGAPGSSRSRHSRRESKSARQAVGDSGRDQRVIRTFHGHGYRFIAPVLESAPSPRGRERSFDGEVTDRPTRAELSLTVDREFPFVGRSDAIERSVDVARRATEGPQALLLCGEPGVGKSRLALKVATIVADEDGFITIGGRCEQHLASSLQPWVEALAAYASSADVEELRQDTVGILDRLAPVLPSLGTRLGLDSPPAVSIDDEFAVVDGIVTLIERASRRRPFVIVLDDVQWAGGATRSLASLLLRRGIARVLLILTYRTTIEDLGVTTGEWLAGLERAGSTRVDVAALTLEDIDRLVEATLGSAASGSSFDIWERSEGHSLFAVELIPRRARRERWPSTSGVGGIVGAASAREVAAGCGEAGRHGGRLRSRVPTRHRCCGR